MCIENTTGRYTPVVVVLNQALKQNVCKARKPFQDSCLTATAETTTWQVAWGLVCSQAYFADIIPPSLSYSASYAPWGFSKTGQDGLWPQLAAQQSNAWFGIPSRIFFKTSHQYEIYSLSFWLIQWLTIGLAHTDTYTRFRTPISSQG